MQICITRAHGVETPHTTRLRTPRIAAHIYPAPRRTQTVTRCCQMQRNLRSQGRCYVQTEGRGHFTTRYPPQFPNNRTIANKEPRALTSEHARTVYMIMRRGTDTSRPEPDRLGPPPPSVSCTRQSPSSSPSLSPSPADTPLLVDWPAAPLLPPRLLTPSSRTGRLCR